MMRIAAMAVLLMCAESAQSAECSNTEFQSQSFTICKVNVSQERLRLFLRRPDGGPFASFRSVNNDLGETGQKLGFAMNAGMYHSDRSPVGLYIENGSQEQALITSEGPGNFGLLPNGVLCLRDGRADVIETLRFEREAPSCTHATQSGPMLVINGDLHPRFLKDGTSTYIRNGVGTSEDGKTAIFAISNEPVNFHSFGSLFRDHLGTPNALYFDGNISRLHAPTLGRSDAGFAMGPIVGTVENDG